MKADSQVTVLFGEGEATYYVLGKGPPSYGHKRRYLAEREAERLARKHPGTKFSVVKLKREVVFTGEAQGDPLSPNEMAKQREARDKLRVGYWVRVVETHHKFPGKIGTVEEIGTGDDTSVMVRIVGSVERFSATSLIAMTRAEEPPTAPHPEPQSEPAPEAKSFGEIIGKLLLDLALRTVFDDGETIADEFKAGDEIYIITDDPAGLMPGAAVPAHYEKISGREGLVWVRMAESDGSPGQLVEVNATRLIHRNDPRWFVLS